MTRLRWWRGLLADLGVAAGIGTAVAIAAAFALAAAFAVATSFAVNGVVGLVAGLAVIAHQRGSQFKSRRAFENLR